MSIPENNTPPRPHSGFTLIEILVALMIVAFGLAALFTTVNQTVRTASYLREKMFAQWIAVNQITEVRLKGQKPSDSKMKGEVEYAGQKWRWELQTINTPVQGIFRLEARAALATAGEDSWPGQATGFLGNAIAVASTEYDPFPVTGQPD